MKQHPIIAPLRAALKHLYRTDYPRDGIGCIHGVDFTVSGVEVKITHGPEKVRDFVTSKRLAIVLTRKRYRLRPQITGSVVRWIEEIEGDAIAIHARRRRAISAALNSAILDHWNGTDGCITQSIVFGLRAPESILSGVRNYRAVGNPFALTEDEIRRRAEWHEWAKPATLVGNYSHEARA